MDTAIGEAAGQMWRYLAQHGEATLRQRQTGTTLPARLLLMGVGWLAREGQLRLIQEGRVLKLALHARQEAYMVWSVWLGSSRTCHRQNA